MWYLIFYLYDLPNSYKNPLLRNIRALLMFSYRINASQFTYLPPPFPSLRLRSSVHRTSFELPGGRGHCSVRLDCEKHMPLQRRSGSVIPYLLSADFDVTASTSSAGPPFGSAASAGSAGPGFGSAGSATSSAGGFPADRQPAQLVFRPKFQPVFRPKFQPVFQPNFQPVIQLIFFSY